MATTVKPPTEAEVADVEVHPPDRFTGIPRDIDYQRDFLTQVILHESDTEELISQTTNAGVVRILLLALMLRKAATVEYVRDDDFKKLTSARLPLQPKPEPGQVVELAFDAKSNRYKATILAEDCKVDVWTDSEIMQGILETAAREAIPIQNLDFEVPTMEIVRGKVNVLLESA
jgi:hypothetical protein